MPESLTTASDVIDALGGTTAVARLTRRKPQHVTNWRSTGRLPPKTFLVLTDALKAHDRTAPATLWDMDEPECPSMSPAAVEDPALVPEKAEVRS